MPPLHALAIFAAGLAAGTVNVIVGSGSLITFPTLLALGYPPVLANVSRLLVSGGLAIAGYSLRRGGFDVDAHDSLARASGLELEDRWSTWDGEPFGPDSTYAVSVHRKAD